MAAFNFEYLPLPSHNSEGTTYVNPELMYSTVAYSQDGATLQGGNGVVLIGSLLSRVSSSDKRVVKYTGATGQKAIGFIRKSADTGATGSPDQHCNVVWFGTVKLEIVCAAYGGTPASIPAAVTSGVSDLAGRIDDGRSFIRI